MLLAIDTSGPVLAIGLFDGTHATAEFREEIGRGHAERLLPEIHRLLDGSDVKPSDLTSISVVTGPGSFMGLRCGIATARSLALGLGIEAIGVSRMQALAPQSGEATVRLDARRGHAFVQNFANGTETGPLRLEPCEDVPGAPPVDLAHVAQLARTHPLPPKPIYGRGADAKPQQGRDIARASQRS